MVASARKCFIKKSLIVLTLGGSAFLGTQIYFINRRFRNLLPPEIFPRERQYVYIKSPELYVGLGDSAAEKYLGAEQIIHTLVRGPKSIASDPNPWHLLRILRSDAYAREHDKVLRTLASATYSDGLAREIAQSMNFKTAVKLARIPGVNPNLFLPPPSFLLATGPEDILGKLYRILKEMPPCDDCTCAERFTKVARGLTDDKKSKGLPQGWMEETVQAVRPARREQILELYLRALLQHTQYLDKAQTMIKNGLLPILWNLAKNSYKNELPAIRSLAIQIVAGLSQFEELHVQIFQSGWIGLLVELLRSRDPRLQLVAGKVLINMDESTRNHGILDASIYQLNPANRLVDQLMDHGGLPFVGPWDVDVVFVHGLLGGVFWTWRQSDVVRKVISVAGEEEEAPSQCWPGDWLPEDAPGMRILGVDYVTSLTHWGSSCPADSNRRTIDARADELLRSLEKAGVGKRPVVFVAHSMGGLLVKEILVRAFKSEDPKLTDVAQSTCGVLMLSVPHSGSALASVHPTVRLLLPPSIEVDELKKDSSRLDRLNRDFLNLLERHPMAVVSIVETKSTPVGQLGMHFKFVEPSSADLGVGEMHFIPADHMDICKPINKSSFVYRRLVELLRGVRSNTPPRELMHQP